MTQFAPKIGRKQNSQDDQPILKKPTTRKSTSSIQRGQPLNAEQIQRLQATYGNQAVQRLLEENPSMQPNTTVQRGFMDFMEGVAGGIASVPMDIYKGAERTIEGLNFGDMDRQAEIGEENERFVELIGEVIENGDAIEDTVSIFVEHIVDQLPPDIVEGAEHKAGGFVAGRISGSVIAGRIAKAIAVRILSSEAVKQLATKVGLGAGVGATGIGLPITMLMLQGVLQRASEASERLESDIPDLYQKLEPQRLDLLWFLIEPQLDDILRQIEQQILEQTGIPIRIEKQHLGQIADEIQRQMDAHRTGGGMGGDGLMVEGR